MLKDPVSDMLTRIRNAQMAHLSEASMPLSSLKEAIAKVLKEEGYVEDYQVVDVDKFKNLVITLKYFRGKPAIRKIRRVSRSGLRQYRNAKQLPKIMGGLGIAIVSTSKGLLTDHAARAQGVGGEIICYVE